MIVCWLCFFIFLTIQRYELFGLEFYKVDFPFLSVLDMGFFGCSVLDKFGVELLLDEVGLATINGLGCFPRGVHFDDVGQRLGFIRRHQLL